MGARVRMRSWFEKLLRPDRRRAERWASPRLSIYYWNGMTPRLRGVKDISSSGIYLMTEAEWSVGVKLMLTLQRRDLAKTSPESWIAVEAEVVRRGPDGLAFSFVPSGCFGSSGRGTDLPHGASQRELNRFLSKLFKNDKSQFRPTMEAPSFLV